MREGNDATPGNVDGNRRPQYPFPHRPDIEGLRAIAVFVVVAFHARVPGFAGGFVGVDVFFVLSGYLITGLLVAEAEQNGTIDLKRFYARRARRLLPALTLVLLVTLAATAVLYAPFEQRAIARTWATTASYVSNIQFAADTLDYFGAGAESNPLLHTWSLSVEEQFYLVWPWLVLLGITLSRWRTGRTWISLSPLRGLFFVLGAATVLSFVWSLYLTETRGGWAFYLSPARAWEFGAGGLAVLLPVKRQASRSSGLRPPAFIPTLLNWIALAGVGVATVFYSKHTPFPGVAALLPVLATVALLHSGSQIDGESPGSLSRFLSLGPLQALGRLSYSWYLWHWPALVFASALCDPLPFTARLAAAGFSLALAHASYTWVEKPLRHHPVLALTPARAFAMALGSAIVVIGLTTVWWKASVAWSSSGQMAEIARARSELPAIYRDDCDRFGQAILIQCTYGDTTADRTAVLVGDSHAGQFFPAVQAAIMEKGWRLVVFTLGACPFVDVSVMFNETLGRPYPECVTWRQSALEAIHRLKPAVIFVGSSSGYKATPESWEAGTSSLLRKLVGRGARVVLIIDPPSPGVDIPVCLGRALWRWESAFDPDCRSRSDPAAQALVRAQERATRSLPLVEVLDVRDAICVGGCTDNGPIPYRDGNHLATEFSRTFSGAFARYLSANVRVDAAVR